MADELHPVVAGELENGPLAIIFEIARQLRGSEDWKRTNILAI